MILTIIFLPLLSFLFAGLLGQYLGNNWTKIITTSLIGVNFATVIYVFCSILVLTENYTVNIGNWIENGLLVIDWSFSVDNLTVVMLVVVNSISFLVHLYSTDYMGNDPHVSRFMSYLSLFTFFMIILITGDNFVLLFLGWEGVGLCSYLLISFWFTRIQANKSAIKALIINRVSDFALTFGLIGIFHIFRSLNFNVVFALIPYFANESFIFFGNSFNIISTISFLLFVGAMGKSAQIGLHTWLPDAMEGPTPVSALIHAATMVTAGVFLLIKCSPIFEYSPKILVFITFIGAITAFFSATVGLVQNDIKKVIAYSTCSQLGYMVFACGLSNYNVALFHLSNHAFFKALLFLSAGSIIHSLSNEQDMRKYGGLVNLLPFTSVMLFIGSLSLMGFPFLTGYYSKDLIIELAYSNYTVNGTFCFWLGLLTACLTSFYSYRVFFLTFIYSNNSFKQVASNVHELPLKMAIVLSILALGSIFFGYTSKELFVGFGTDFWNQNIVILPQHNKQFNIEFIPQAVKMMPLFGSILSVIAVNLVFALNLDWLDFFGFNFKKIYAFLSYKWYFDVIYNKLINLSLFRFCYNNLFKTVDKGFLEHIGPHFFSTILFYLSNTTRKLQTGQVYRYGYFMLLFYLVTILCINVVY